MRSIEPLPDAVRSSVRSGIILFDLTRVVEELIFNSLDAGATKVSVFLGIGTCYVKAIDNGSGITRDGLVLLGERYVTSKLHHFADMDAASGSFGFRGEALASISDVSLLDVATKAYGRPNGYRKVIKGCKCLYLGIDDDRKDVGTTVVVRDLFYNQPVRRKYMQASPKKVLHCVKKCVFRIALVHSKVSFKIVDIESEDELLCTHPSSSPSLLLMSGFGIEVSRDLHELDVSNGVLKLSGYVSGPCESFAIKDFQYVYINSRFICKGPIHRLLNQLATRFECLDPWKASDGSQNRKRSRSQVHPSYILNLSCPRSLYDLTFEPSKTCVEFKDWVPVLTFVEKAIQHLWRENITNGESFSHAADLLGKDEMGNEDRNVISTKEDFFVEDLYENPEAAKKKSRIQIHEASLGLPSSPFEMVTKEGKRLSNREHDGNPNKNQLQNIAELESRTEEEFVHEADYSFQSWGGSYPICKLIGTQTSENDPWTSDNTSIPDFFAKNKFTAAEKSNGHVDDDIFNSTWGDESLKVDLDASNLSAGTAICPEFHKFNNDVEVGNDIRKPFLQSCSSRGTLPLDKTSLASDEIFEFQIDGFRTKQKWTGPDNRVDTLDIDVSNQSYDLFARALRQDEASYAQPFPKLKTQGDMHAVFDVFSRASANSLASYAEDFAQEGELQFDSVTQMGNFDSDHHSLNSEWCSVTSDPLFQAKSWDIAHLTYKNALKRDSRSGKKTSDGHFMGSEVDFRFKYDFVSKSSSQENHSSFCTTTQLDFKDYAGSSKDISESVQGHNLDNKCFPQYSGISSDETDWLCLDLCKDYTDIKYEGQRNSLHYPICEENHVPKERSRRSHSAPPFYRHKRRYISLNYHSTTEAGEPNAQTFHGDFTSPEAGKLKHPQRSCGVRHLYCEPNFLEDLSFDKRSDIKKLPEITLEIKEIRKGEKKCPSQCLHLHNNAPVKDFISKEIQDSLNSDTKWRNSCAQTAVGDKLHDIHDQSNVLDVSSEFLHLSGDSVVPESINKNCLEDAKVLQQVDKKFIPVVADGTLAIIDQAEPLQDFGRSYDIGNGPLLQHAADERIRLEELRRKVLSGEAKSITYLDAEQELTLPEIGYQLLHNYAEQIEDWGWICNIQAQGSRSFKKNLNILHQQPAIVTLLAVPCILGVNLSDVDLLEFLQQLSDTDGSSTMPPSVLRVLNSKACRGAIMFGDSLLPSECSLIVAELKQTSLCFQCAHGRPTTVPLVNLGALHKQIAKLKLLNDSSKELWHGLCRHGLSLERAARRLSSAMGRC